MTMRPLNTLLLSATLLTLSVPALADTLPLRADPLLPAAPTSYARQSLSGGPGKDGIPSIDQPKFWSAERAGDFLEPADRIIGVYRNGEARAYPQRVLVWHEIVNDTFGGDNVSISYCPLTGTALGFERGETELGVSGRLVNSNLIMYDRESDSYWSQILGAAIDGPHAGAGLKEFRVVWTTWEQWRQRHPETRVLSSDTGHMRNYRRDPYGSYTPAVRGYYAESAQPIFPIRDVDDRYPPKREVLGFRTAAGAVAVDREHLAAQGVITYQGEDGAYLIVNDPGLDTGWIYRAAGGSVPDLANVTFGPAGPEHPALEALEPVNGFEAMWFAWYAFYPETVVIDGRDN